MSAKEIVIEQKMKLLQIFIRTNWTYVGTVASTCSIDWKRLVTCQLARKIDQLKSEAPRLLKDVFPFVPDGFSDSSFKPMLLAI